MYAAFALGFRVEFELLIEPRERLAAICDPYRVVAVLQNTSRFIVRFWNAAQVCTHGIGSISLTHLPAGTSECIIFTKTEWLSIFRRVL